MPRLLRADAFASLVRHEGPLALWKGLTPSLIRAVCYGGLRLGLYRPITVLVDSSPSAGPRPADADGSPPGSPARENGGGEDATGAGGQEAGLHVIGAPCGGDALADVDGSEETAEKGAPETEAQ